MNYTDDQLKRALAKMLPEQLYQLQGDTKDIYWSHAAEACHKDQRGLCVIDTELLHICWLIEETLTPQEQHMYGGLLGGFTPWSKIHTAWEERTVRLAFVKGIKI